MNNQHPASTCLGKQQHDAATARMLAARKQSKNPGLNAYRCDECGYWHVGGGKKVRGRKLSRGWSGRT